MTENRIQVRKANQEDARPEVIVAEQTDQAMAERLLLETLPRPQPAVPSKDVVRPDGEWPEHLQREMDLAIVTTFMSVGVIGIFLWMSGLFF